MHRKLSAFAIAFASLSLAACSTPAPAPAPAESSSREPLVIESATPEPEPTPTESRSVRGNLVFDVGDEMDIQAGGTTFASFAVDKIDTKVKCTEPYADPVAKGSKLIALTVSAKTEPAGAVDDLDFYFNSAWLTFVDANGVTYNGDLGGSATYSCLPESKLLPGDLGPGSKAKGLVLLEVPSLDGMLVHSEYGLEMDLAKSIKKSD